MEKLERLEGSRLEDHFVEFKEGEFSTKGVSRGLLLFFIFFILVIPPFCLGLIVDIPRHFDLSDFILRLIFFGFFAYLCYRFLGQFREFINLPKFSYRDGVLYQEGRVLVPFGDDMILERKVWVYYMKGPKAKYGLYLQKDDGERIKLFVSNNEEKVNKIIDILKSGHRKVKVIGESAYNEERGAFKDKRKAYVGLIIAILLVFLL